MTITMKRSILPIILALSLLRVEGTLGITVTNTISNSWPRLGKAIQLSCYINGGTAWKVKWSKDGLNGSTGANDWSENCLVIVEEYKSKYTKTMCDWNNYNFQLSNFQFSDRGYYWCTADGIEATTRLRLDVLHAPDSLQLKTTTSSNSKSENETETFTCKAIGGHPVPLMKLIREKGTTRETLTEENNSVVIFRRRMMRLDNQVKFYCEGTGPGIPNNIQSAKVMYNVFFPHKVQVKIRKTTVNEHEFVRFECATSGGYPERIERYQWLWRKNGTTANQVINDTVTGTQDGRFLEFACIPYDKSGSYSCKAWNLGGVGQASTVLSVQYSPRLDPGAKIKNDVIGVIGKEASFELFITANPSPVTTGYVWFKEDNILSESSGNDYEIISGPTASKLKIKNVQVDDYKTYKCSVKTSGFEAKVFEFKLLKVVPPTSPSKLNVVNSTAVSATLKWISEFNGGSEQRFYIQYKKSAENWEGASEIPQGGITDPGLNKVVYYKVMDLESNVLYEFRGRSKNSDSGTHTRDFSNIASGKTQEKPQTSLICVNRTDSKVILRCEVTGRYTLLMIRYCQAGTDDCMNYTVSNAAGDNTASLYIDADKTYTLNMVVEDGGDVVYTSAPFIDDVNNKCNAQVNDDKTNILVLAVTGCLVGTVIVAITGITVAVVLSRNRGKKQRHRPPNDADDYDGTMVEFTIWRYGLVQTYANSLTDYVNDVFPPELTLSPNLEQPRVTVHHVPVDKELENELSSSDDDIDAYAYDYVDSAFAYQQDVSSLNPEPRETHTKYATPYEQFGRTVPIGGQWGQQGQGSNGTHDYLELIQGEPSQSTAESISSQATRQQDASDQKNVRKEPVDITPNVIMQRQEETEVTFNDLRIIMQGETCQSVTESGSDQTDGTQELTTSCSSDDAAHGQDSPYAELDQVATIKHGEYLDLRQLIHTRKEPEVAYENVRIVTQGEPSQIAATRGINQDVGSQELTRSCSSDDVAHDKESP